MSQKLRVEIDVAGEQTSSNGTGAVSKVLEKLRLVLTFPDGTDPDKADAMWGDDRTVNGGVVDGLELDNLPGVSAVGPVTLSKVKGIAILNESDSDYLTLGCGTGGVSAPAADAWSDTDAGVDGSPFSADGAFIRVAAGDAFLWTARDGVDVVNTTADVLGVEGHMSNQDYKILVWGND